jgi:hypothetical protein
VRAASQILTAALLATAALAQEPNLDEGMEGTLRLKIPEPMVFDLVRPLGSKVGELEVNTLAVVGRDGRLRWNPEIEMVVFPWLALEFELPMENTALETYKIAAQGRLKRIGSIKSPYTQGWQTIFEAGRLGNPSQFAALYISAVRWSPRLSTLSLNGWQTTWSAGQRGHEALVNNTFFWQSERRPVVGLETNFRVKPQRVSSLLMPQIHIPLPGKFSLQCGAGAERSLARLWGPAVSARLIWEGR